MGTNKQSSRHRIASLVKRGTARLQALAASTRPAHADTEAALRRRWTELPQPVRTPAQLPGRRVRRRSCRAGAYAGAAAGPARTPAQLPGRCVRRRSCRAGAYAGAAAGPAHAGL